MNKPERTGPVNEALLDGENYFVSLFTEALSHGLMSQAEADSLRAGFFTLLGKKTLDFTDGKSSSVRTEQAEALMSSVFYTASLALKSCPSVYDAIDMMKTQSAEEIYSAGRKRLETKLKTAKLYRSLVLKTMLKCDNRTYKATLDDGIKGFFRLYDPEFGADRTVITADYPLFIPVTGLCGIEFICKYLESAYYENLFCSLFTQDGIKNVLKAVCSDPAEDVFSIFGSVLTAALNCALSGGDPVTLRVTKAGADYLAAKAAPLGVYDMRRLYSSAAEKLLSVAEVKNTAETAYVISAAGTVGAEVHRALSLNAADRVFFATCRD